LWIVRESMVSRSEINAALTFAKGGGFNHVFVQVRGRGDAYYQSRIVPRSPYIRDAGFDPLDYAIHRGHELGINVHAWVTTYLLWSARTPPEDKGHIYHLHPEWLEVDARGRAQKDVDLGAPRDGKFEGIFLSPVHPEVNGYLQAVFTELILNYNIDGLHLDYSRYHDLDYGYNEEGLGVFRRRHEFDPRELDFSATVASPVSGEGQRQLEIWNGYRRQKITDLVTALHAIITLSGKEVLLTAAVKPDPAEASRKFYQEWTKWLEDRILDYALPMNYTPDLEQYLQATTRITAQLPAWAQKRVIMGVATYNQDALATTEKIRLARQHGFNSICVFSYDSHKTNLTHFNPIIAILNREGHSP